MRSLLSHGVLLSLSTLLVAVTPLSFSNENLFAMRGGGLFGKDEKDEKTAIATEERKKFPAMSQEEVEELLAHIPVFAVTDSTGNGVVLKPEEGSSVFYFFMSAQMANATLTQLKGDDESMDLRVSAFSLGKVWFKVLKSEAKPAIKLKQPGSTSEDGAVTTNDVEYRLVPDTRDLLGARMLLTMDPEDGETLKSGGSLTPEMAQAAIKKAMTESPKFNSTYNEIPVFMIQQMRMQKQTEDGTVSKDDPTVLPMYFNLQNMVALWQQFTSQSDEAKGIEPAINLMDLNDMVEKMLEESEIDFRNVILVPSSPPGAKPIDATSANGEQVEPPTSSPDEPFKMPGDTTLGDL